MKDLYRRNHLESRESDPVKINSCEGGFEEDQEAAFSILLSEKKKKIYDRAHEALEVIGYIRGHCDLNTQEWRKKNGDFYQTITTNIPIVPETPGNKARNTSRENKQPPLTKHSVKSRYWIPAVGILAAFLLYFYLNQEESEIDEQPTINKYVTEMDVPVYQSPNRQSPELVRLEQYRDLVINSEQSVRGWDFIETGSRSGFIESNKVAVGNGYDAMIDSCRGMGIARPESGQILNATAFGINQLIVSNPPGHDALVKLRKGNEDAAMFFYVRADSHVTIKNVPDGSFNIFFETGENFGSACSSFLDNVAVFRDDKKHVFRSTLDNGAEYPTVLPYILKSELFGVDQISPEKF